MKGRPLWLVAVGVALVVLYAFRGEVLPADAPPDTLPARLTDQQFWRLVTELSEPNGSFRSENLVSNEHTFQYVIPALQKAVPPGGVYLGVAPDQNFTYMAATRPKMAFILDIRRGNLLELLMYKAVTELSADRADFVSRLFSKPRPAGLSAKSSVAEIFTACDRVPTDEKLYHTNLDAVRDHLVKTHGFALSEDDLTQLTTIYFSFFWEGPGLRYTANPQGFGGAGGRGFGNTNFPTYEDLVVMTDWEGEPRSYLATEENYQWLKAFQEKNLIVPIVGNFAGPKALRGIGQYIRSRGSVVSAFYVSNVEQYLFMDGIWSDFARNVATLPVNGSSTFIRSVATRYGYEGKYLWVDGRASALDPIRALVKDFQAGRVRTYPDVNARSK